MRHASGSDRVRAVHVNSVEVTLMLIYFLCDLRLLIQKVKV